MTPPPSRDGCCDCIDQVTVTAKSFAGVGALQLAVMVVIRVPEELKALIFAVEIPAVTVSVPAVPAVHGLGLKVLAGPGMDNVSALPETRVVFGIVRGVAAKFLGVGLASELLTLYSVSLPLNELMPAARAVLTRLAGTTMVMRTPVAAKLAPGATLAGAFSRMLPDSVSAPRVVLQLTEYLTVCNTAREAVLAPAGEVAPTTAMLPPTSAADNAIPRVLLSRAR